MNPTSYEIRALSIPGTASGVYLAYPTVATLKPTYRGHKTMVNLEHTKVGIATTSFIARENEYIATFQHEVAFFPLLELSSTELPTFENKLLAELCKSYQRSGTAREWFRTVERQAIAELVWRMHEGA